MIPKSLIPVLVGAAVLIAAPAACTRQSLETLYDTQEKTIENFVNARLAADSTATVTYRDGSARVTLTAGSGDTLTTSGTVSFYYAGYTLSGTSISASNLFWTNHEATAEAAGWALSDSTVFTRETVSLSDGTLVTGLRNGLVGVQGGEECYILFSGRYGFGRHAIGTISANAPLVYHVRVHSVLGSDE